MPSPVRPTLATIDLDQLATNFRAIRASLRPETGVLAAIKGDAYGHGAVACAGALEQAGCDWFGVALIEEGKQLRAAGIKRPILSMGGVGLAGADEAIDARLTPVISDLESAARLEQAAARRREPVGVHLKVDTGMGRLGVPLPHWEALLDRMASLKWLRVDGIATHFAESDGLTEASRVFTREQARRFLEAVRAARARGLRPSLLHTCNSGGVIYYPEYGFDLVRPGLLLYGYNPAGPECPIPVAPVMRVTTKVLLVRDLPAGVGVSYGRTWVTPRPSRIATLPVGYADGYPRALSNRGGVLIHGHVAPIRGRVCMDLTMVDVTDIPVPVEAGDEVTLMGAQGDARITAWDLATQADTIPYEILAGWSDRVPRAYTRAGEAA